MQDSISKGQGNSRYLKSVANFKALYPTYDDFVNALVAGTLPVDFNGKNNAGWQQIGTELSKANLMSDQSASLFNLSSSNVPDDIFDLIGRGLPIRNGGTGATTGAKGFYNLMYALSIASAVPNSYYIPIRNGSSCYELDSNKLSSALATAMLPNIVSSIKPSDIGAAAAEYGSYTGTGLSGVSYPNHITFKKIPMLVFVSDENGRFIDMFNNNLPAYGVAFANTWPTTYTKEFGFGGSYPGSSVYLYGKRSGNSLYWYSVGSSNNGPIYQNNKNGATYHYVAFY